MYRFSLFPHEILDGAAFDPGIPLATFTLPLGRGVSMVSIGDIDGDGAMDLLLREVGTW